MAKTALITGASSGIGYEFARLFSENGNNLVLVALGKERLLEIKKEITEKTGVSVCIIEKDLTVAGAAEDVFNEVTGQGISIDYLINNAGIGDFGHFSECNWAKQEKMILLNIMAVAHLTRLFLPELIKKCGGRILNVASTSAFQPGPTMSVYFASKAFVLSFSEAIANELKDKGITVTALCPGSTETNFHAVVMGDASLLKQRKKSSPAEVAAFGYESMMKGKTVAIPGFKNKFMSFAIRFLPRSVVTNAARRIQEKKHI